MTTEELSKEMASQLKQNILLKDIKEWAAGKGFTPEQIKTSMEEAHVLVQQQADRDPVLRLILGPALLIVAFMAFYTDWAGRSVGFATFFGLIMFLLGGRLVWSLVKQWTKK